MGKQNSGSPFALLGRQLKALRTRSGESLAEASGAVEIDVRELASFELGDARPTEDVLLLLISHFSAGDDEAIRMWETAGYGSTKNRPSQADSPDAQIRGAENPILFTDVVDIIVNNYGVVMNFMQSTAPNGTPANIARVGMSREHAKSVLQILQATLAQTEKDRLRSSDTSAPDHAH